MNEDNIDYYNNIHTPCKLCEHLQEEIAVFSSNYYCKLYNCHIAAPYYKKPIFCKLNTKPMITNDKDFVECYYEGKEYTLLGWFNYETKRIRGIKVPHSVYSGILNFLNEVMVKTKQYAIDNKRVYIFQDNVNFGTKDFAIFFHDAGAIIRGWNAVINY